MARAASRNAFFSVPAYLDQAVSPANSLGHFRTHTETHPHDRRCSSFDNTLLADKGYDADAIREELAKADAVIPARSNRREPIPHDREKYRWRNLVERLFNKLKNWRRVATRYDKTKESYLGSSVSSQSLIRN